jgi:hypothetical protein
LKNILVILVLFAGWPSAAQMTRHAESVAPAKVSQRLEPYLATLPDAQVYSTGLDEFVQKLDRRQANFRTEQQFLQYLFTRIHQTHLKRFQDYARITDLFSNGAYNCLTATILISTVLDYFEIDHEVIETNYHIFILARTKEGEVLIESTDAREGFVTSPEMISRRIALYRENSIQSTNSELSYYRFGFDLYNTVSQPELVGLLYYNQAIEAFNNQAIVESVSCLMQAGERYVSPRIEEFSELLLVAVHESKLRGEEKTRLKRTLQAIRYKALPAVASSLPH